VIIAKQNTHDRQITPRGLDDGPVVGVDRNPGGDYPGRSGRTRRACRREGVDRSEPVIRAGHEGVRWSGRASSRGRTPERDRSLVQSPPLEPNSRRTSSISSPVPGSQLSSANEDNKKASLHGTRDAHDRRDAMRFRRMAGDKFQQVGQALGVGEHDERARVVGERSHLSSEAFGVRCAGAAPGDGQVMHIDPACARSRSTPANGRTTSRHNLPRSPDEGHTVAPGQVRRG